MQRAELVDLYGIAFLLEDVKVTLRRDIDLRVADIHVEGQADEILNLPRWVAQALESAGHVSVEDADMAVELKQATVKENVQGDFDLSTLEPYFYIRMHAYMQRLDRDDLDRVESMLKTLVRKRRSKIVRLADSAKLNAALAKKLTVEEKMFYNRIHGTSASFVGSVLGDSKTRVKTLSQRRQQ